MEEGKDSIKSKMKKGIQPDTLTKSRATLGNTLKTYIQVNWKI
jgi:hypothetical protein